jgi:hypothetical protein
VKYVVNGFAWRLVGSGTFRAAVLSMEKVNRDTSGTSQRGPSGIPGPHGLGASKKEAMALAAALVGLILMGLGFWYEAAK